MGHPCSACQTLEAALSLILHMPPNIYKVSGEKYISHKVRTKVHATLHNKGFFFNNEFYEVNWQIIYR